MNILSTNPAPKVNGKACVIHDVGNIKAGTAVMIINIKGEVAEVVNDKGNLDGYIPLQWLVALPD